MGRKSKQRRKREKSESREPAARKQSRGWTSRDVMTVVAACAVGLSLGLAIWWATHPAEAPVVAAQESANGATAREPAPPAEKNAEPAAAEKFAPLQGRWLRPDGGYVLDIRRIAEDGQMDAAYLNPRSIRVAKAEAAQTGESLKVFVELRDVNYPGSTYDLTFDPKTDRLSGDYFQAAQQQHFDVVFERQK